jgi:transcriptional regulator with GAF, ATPase, and Fis domain
MTTKAGYFEDAADGTLFLDEIGELALDLQAKLLRVLENGEYQRVGETRKRVSQARIIAATNRDLRQGGQGRQLPRRPLSPPVGVFDRCPAVARDGRRQAAPARPLPAHYAAQTQQQPFHLAAEAEALWRSYAFPGNVRELRNIVIRLTTRHAGQVVGAAALEVELDLPDEPPPAAAPATSMLDQGAAMPSSLRPCIACGNANPSASIACSMPPNAATSRPR